MEHWTIRELSDRVAAELAGYEAAENGQVRAVPNARTIRYYTTQGLVSRPAVMRGRTALYDRRHLAELVAIKRLQASGKTLADIQETLAQASPEQIEAIAALAEVAPHDPPSSTHDDPKSSSASAAAFEFWRQVPSEVDAEPEPAATPDFAAEPEPAAKPAPAAKPPLQRPSAPADASRAPAETLIGFKLAPGVTLLIDSDQLATHPDPAALRRAAAPLLAALKNGRAGNPA